MSPPCCGKQCEGRSTRRQFPFWWAREEADAEATREMQACSRERALGVEEEGGGVRESPSVVQWALSLARAQLLAPKRKEIGVFLVCFQK